MKKLLKWKPSEKIIAVLFGILLAMTMIPLIRLGQYAVPWYDDYLLGRSVKYALETGGGILDILKGAWHEARTEWYAYQGTYSSDFFMALMPAAWGQQYYFLSPTILVIMPVLGVFAIIGVLSRDICGFGRIYTFCLQAAVSVMVLMFVYTAKPAFYWHVGGVHYIGMHAIMLLYIAMVIKLVKVKGKILSALLVLGTMVGALLTGGSNFVTALQGVLLILSVAGAAVFARNRRVTLLVPAILVNIAGFFMNVFAPGNNVRKASYVGWGYSPVEAVLKSFVEAFKHFWVFTGWITIAVLVLLVPIIWQMVRKSSFSFRYPGILSLWSFCLYATGFTPSLYSLGNAGLSRTLNAVKITFQILLVINEVYWLGYFCRKMEKKGRQLPDGRCGWWFYPVMGAVMLVIFSAASNQAGNYSAYGAYYYVHSGEAYNFYHEYLARVEQLQGDEPDVRVKPYVFRPWFLCMGDWSEDPGDEMNRAIASWFGKNSVACAKAENDDEAE